MFQVRALRLLLRLEELPSRCCLAGASEGCERSLADDMDDIAVLLAIFCRALPFNDGRKNGMVGNGPVDSPPLLLFMAPWSLSDPRIRSLTPIPARAPGGGLNAILLPIETNGVERKISQTNRQNIPQFRNTIRLSRFVTCEIHAG